MRRLALSALAAATGLALAPPAAPGQVAPVRPLVVEIVVAKKGVQGGRKRVVVTKGRRVVLLVRSALSGEVHLHGYDLKRRVSPGRRVRLAFAASLVGRFELELHARVPLQLAVIEVRP